MIVAEYVSNYGLRIADRVLDLAQFTTPGGTRINKTGVAPAAARALISEGHAPETILRLTRGGRPVFEDRTLAWWAGQAIEEGAQSARFRSYRPYRPE